MEDVIWNEDARSGAMVLIGLIVGGIVAYLIINCPFKKNGVPSLGTFGASEQPVVIFTLETWKKLCADVPQLQTTQFEVGSYVEE